MWKLINETTPIVGHIIWVEETRNTQRVLVGKPFGKFPL
jgi:hypothetical protein